MKIAIVGTGVSGLVAARLLCGDHEIHVYEAAGYAGGHANTVEVRIGGETYPVDTGFMVFNERTYPNFCQLLKLLGVTAQNSDMSLSVQCQRSGLEYQASSLGGLFAQRVNLLRPSFYGMLKDISRFNRDARAFLRLSDNHLTLGQFLEPKNYGRALFEDYLVPMTAAIWSARPECIRDFPARIILQFFENHGLLQLRDRPQWKTICGGSRRYVDVLMRPFRQQVRLNSPVRSVTRHHDHVAIESSGDCVELFDAVVMATHADQTLRLLTDINRAESEILRAFPYQENEAILHMDVSMLPSRRRAWASWNYHVAQRSDRPVSVTYDLSRLQNVRSPQRILLTLNPVRAINRSKTIRSFSYHHPAFSLASTAAQRRLHEINGKNRTYFCGAYWRYGFHEDGVRSALAVGRCFGKDFDSCTVASTKEVSGTAALAR